MSLSEEEDDDKLEWQGEEISEQRIRKMVKTTDWQAGETTVEYDASELESCYRKLREVEN